MAAGTKWTNDEISALVSAYSEKNVQDCMEEVIQRMKEQWRRKNDATIDNRLKKLRSSYGKSPEARPLLNM